MADDYLLKTVLRECRPLYASRKLALGARAKKSKANLRYDDYDSLWTPGDRHAHSNTTLAGKKRKASKSLFTSRRSEP